MVLAYAVKDGRLAVNAATGVSLPRVQQSEPRYLTHPQVADLANASGDQYRLVVKFLAYTGVRWGETAALSRAAGRLPPPTRPGRRVGDAGQRA